MRVLRALALSLSLGGCAALPWPPADLAPQSMTVGPDGALDLRGVVHVHTEASHDSPGTLDEVAAAARGAGLAWVARTEHTRPGRPQRAEVRDGVALLPGFEVSAAGGSILAIGVAERPPRRRDPARLVDWIHRHGGAAFVGHLESSDLRDPDAYAWAGPDGIELVNLHAAAVARRLRLVAGLLFLPAPRALRVLPQPPTANLAVWDGLPDPRAIVAGTDAHQRFRALGPLGGSLDRYRDLFRLVTTHVRACDATPSAIVAALRAGRSYVAVEALGRVDAFVFQRVQGTYLLSAPRRARLSLVCDGEVVESVPGVSARIPRPPSAHMCRAEAWLGRRLWIVTSYGYAETLRQSSTVDHPKEDECQRDADDDPELSTQRPERAPD